MTPEFRKVDALLQLGRVDAALDMMERLPAREAPTLDFYRLRGKALRAAGRYFDAEAAWRDALRLAPQEASVLAELAATLHAQKRYQDALAYAREAVALRPEVAAWHCLRGVVAEALQLLPEAEAELRLAQELAPNDAGTHSVLGWLLLRAGRGREAEEAFSAALAVDPRSLEATRGLARALHERGERVEARRLWLEVLALDPLQKDAVLDENLLLGHPLAGPLRLARRVPIGVSALLALPAALLLARAAWTGFQPEPLAAVVIALSLLAASSAPLLRVLTPGGPRA